MVFRKSYFLKLVIILSLFLFLVVLTSCDSDTDVNVRFPKRYIDSQIGSDSQLDDLVYYFNHHTPSTDSTYQANAQLICGGLPNVASYYVPSDKCDTFDGKIESGEIRCGD